MKHLLCALLALPLIPIASSAEEKLPYFKCVERLARDARGIIERSAVLDQNRRRELEAAKLGAYSEDQALSRLPAHYASRLPAGLGSNVCEQLAAKPEVAARTDSATRVIVGRGGAVRKSSKAAKAKDKDTQNK